MWRTQRVQVNVASLRLFLRSSTGPNRAFEPQSLGRVRDPVRIAEGPTAIAPIWWLSPYHPPAPYHPHLRRRADRDCPNFNLVGHLSPLVAVTFSPVSPFRPPFHPHDLHRRGHRVDALRLCCTTFASRLLFFLLALLASITFSEVTLRTSFPEPPLLLEASRIKLATSELMLTDFVCARSRSGGAAPGSHGP